MATPEKKLQAQIDAVTLTKALEIKADPARAKAAQTAAKTQAREAARSAKRIAKARTARKR